MSFKIVRNDISENGKYRIPLLILQNDHTTVGSGCDYAVYTAAGYDDLFGLS